MSRRFNKKQKFEKNNNLEQLAKNAVTTWQDFPTDVLTKAWATKTNVLKAIVNAKGGNGFDLPHAKDPDMENFDWEEMYEECEDESTDEEEENESSDEDD